METISKSTILVFDAQNDDIVNSSAPSVASPGLVLSRCDGHAVDSYMDLLTKVASLAYYNPRFQLLFRGQKRDYPMNAKTTTSNLYPSILRDFSSRKQAWEQFLDEQFRILGAAESLLMKHVRHRDVLESNIVRWAILQHYQVCSTPLLDVTQSLQTALTFAVGECDGGWLYVLAFPQLSGGVSVSIESKTQVINLAQVCPPEASRPHFQSGFLVSDYPEIGRRKQSHRKRNIANNFACRLLTKFRLTNCRLWGNEGFCPTPKGVLFPNQLDQWFEATEKVRDELDA